MMKEELGLIVDEVYNPIAKTITTFIAFYIVGLILLIPFFLYFLNLISFLRLLLYQLVLKMLLFIPQYLLSYLSFQLN